MDSGFICLNLHTKELCPPGRLTFKRAPHELRRAWVLGKAVWVLHVKEVWRENEDKGPSLNHQQPSGGWAVGSWSPGPLHPLQDGSAFLSNWDPQHPGPPASRTPLIQDPPPCGFQSLLCSCLEGRSWGQCPAPGPSGGDSCPRPQEGKREESLPAPLSQSCFRERPSRKKT